MSSLTRRRVVLLCVLAIFVARPMLAVAAVGVFSSNPAPIAPINSTASASPTFSWSAASRFDANDAATRYEIYLWNTYSGQVVWKTGLTGTSYGLTPETINLGTMYKWWVRASDTVTGQTSNWSGEAVFSRPPDTAPTLTAPAGSLSDPAQPAFTWNYTGSIASPAFELYVVNRFNNSVLDKFNVQSGYTPSGGDSLPTGYCFKYYVRAYDPSSTASSDWSSEGNFCRILDQGAVPVAVSPSGIGVGDQSGGPYSTQFCWTYSAAGPTTHYDLRFSGVRSGATVEHDDITGTCYTVTGADRVPADSALMFWVRARDSGGGGVGEWSDPMSFNSLDVPTITLIDVTTTTTQTTKSPTFRFTHPNQMGQSYMHYDFHLFSGDTGGIWDEYDVAGTDVGGGQRDYTLSAVLNAGYRYYYHIRSRDIAYNTLSPWSPFVTTSTYIDIPLYGGVLPTGLSPSGTITGPSATFSWTYAAGDANTRFEIYIFNRSDNVLVYNGSTLTGSTTTTDTATLGITLPSGKLFDYWVRAKDSVGGGYSQWSALQQFGTN